MPKLLTAIIRKILLKTKHGPIGSGMSGACDKDCLKCDADRWLHNTRDQVASNPPIKWIPKDRCEGVYDDGIADGNLTKCSTSSGCGLLGCPYVPQRPGPPQWEIVSDDRNNSVRRLPVNKGWLYQVQTGRQYSTAYGTIGRDTDSGTPMWSEPVFVPK